MISKITAAEFAQQIVTAIQNRNTAYDVNVGPIPDLVVNPLSNVLTLQNERIRSVQQLLSLINDGSFTDSDVDNFVYNELLIRLTGAPAFATLIFSRAALPTANITVQANFPVATVADQTTGNVYTFLTTATTTLVAASASNYFNTTTQRYELQIPAMAVAGGAGGNVAANTIIRPLRALNGFDTVYNRNPATGGSDPETTPSLISRYYISLRGTSPGDVFGIEKILADNYPAAIDSYVVYGNNPLNVRSATDGGAVDVFIQGVQSVSATDTTIFPGANQNIPLLNQPVIAITSVPGYTQGTDYILQPDTSGYADSIKSTAGILWLPGGTLPTVGSSVSVTYTYNSLVDTLQTDFNQPDFSVPGRNLLFKSATEESITLSANISIGAGFNVANVVTAVQTAISTLINGGGLGYLIEGSTINATARSFSAVTNFVITNLSIVGSMGTADIQLAPNQYPNITVADIILIVT